MKGLTTGRIVHYVLHEGCAFAGEHRPAIIVNDWADSSYENGECNLTVFTDHKNDFGDGPESNGIMWVTSIPYDEEKKPGTWHWIEKA